MKKIVLLIILTVLLILPLYAQVGKIAGRVTIEKSGQPLANAAVILVGADQGTYTKNNGTFTLTDVPVGIANVQVRYMGYGTQTFEVDVKENETAIINAKLVVESIGIEGITVSENRAVKRETPVAFTDLSQEEIINKYTTEDVPGLLEGVPGLFSSGGGLGEGELRIRGFDQDKVQIMINGIPVNDPESQVVYWSNWTGLSSNVKSVQVQRGAGASLYGSGAFGGSVNIETMGSENHSEITFRTSSGYYTTDGKSADENGIMSDYNPINYTTMLKYGITLKLLS